MKNKFIVALTIVFLLNPTIGAACTMYKITKNGKTIVGNNEDWISPNSQFWYEPGTNHKYGVMYMGLLDNFAQGGINEAGLVFDGFANPELPINNTEGKITTYIGTAIKNIMQEMKTVREVRNYLSTLNLSSLSSSQIVFVDKTGAYLIVEGDELIMGKEKEKAFSNFYYSQVSSEEEVKLENFQNGLKFLKNSRGKSSLPYCGKAMQHFSSSKLFGTQYSTIYDLDSLKVRVYLFHDYSEYIEIDLKEELKKGEHKTMIANLFPKESIGYQHYSKYNNSENPTLFLEEILNNNNNVTEDELIAMDFNSIVISIGYEWLNKMNNPEVAIKIFKYGVSLMPNDANLHDCLGEAYLVNDDWENSILNYAKSLTLNPKNDNAIEKLLKAKKKRQKFKEKSFKQLTGLVDQYTNEVLSNNNLNSVSVAIYRNGNSYHNYYGELEKNTKNKPNDSTLFEIASISKVFLGSLIAEAVLEGKIKLDDDIRKYLKDDYPNLAFEGTAISIKNLVTHTIGFDTPHGLRNTYNKISKGLYKNKELNYNMNSLLEELKTVELTKKPGTFYSYNNVGSELAAYILEQVNNRTYKEQLQDFLDELGMKNTYLQDFEKHSKHLAVGYDETNNLAPFDKNPLIGGSAGMISTLPDLEKLMQFQLESNNPIVKEATKTLFEDKNGNVMGYLWQDMGVAKEEGFYYSKTGDANGIKSGMLICPDSNYGQIVIINNQTEGANNDWGTLFGKIETDLIKYPKINLYNLIKPEFIKNKKSALAKFNTLNKKSELYFNTDLMWTLNMIGYDLIKKKETKKAIKMFEFALEQSQEDFNLYASLGEVYFLVKDYKNALINYKKSLELNPNNDKAKKHIEKINIILKG